MFESKEPPIEKSPSEERLEKLANAMEKMKGELSAEELDSVKAILLFGSTARGTAGEQSDIDIFIAPDEKKNFSPETAKKIMQLIEEGLPDREIQFGCKPIFTPKGRSAKFVTRRSSKHPEETPNWNFLFSRSPKDETDIDKVLQESQKEQQLVRPITTNK